MIISPCSLRNIGRSGSGSLLVVIVLVGRERITSWTQPFRRLADRLDWRRYRKDGA